MDASVRRVRALYDKYIDVNALKANPTRLENIRLQAKASELERCHQVYRRIYRLLDKVSEHISFFKEQWEYIKAVLGGMAPMIYGAAFANNELEIKRVNALDSVNPFIIFEIYRRGGKTTTSMILVAILMQCVRSIKIIGIAPKKRQAGSDSGMMGVLRSTFSKYFPEEVFDHANQERLTIKRADGDERSFFSYSAAAGDG